MADAPPAHTTSPPVRYLDTTAAYDLWSEVYDTDGNFLQALDTIEMKQLVPRMTSLIDSHPPWRMVDLGCGTGRNTTALLAIPESQVIGLDASPKMLDLARVRLQQDKAHAPDRLRLEVFDLLQSHAPPEYVLHADAVVSTLVLEHVPVDIFFQHVSQILKPGGILLLTNMHSQMGGISQAGFVHPQTGQKIRPKSYAHTVAEVEAEARRHGFEVVGEIEERSVDESLTTQLGERSQKWIGIQVWFGGIFRKKGDA